MNVTDVLVIYSFIAAKRNRLRETLTKLNFNYAAKSRFKNFKKNAQQPGKNSDKNISWHTTFNDNIE